MASVATRNLTPRFELVRNRRSKEKHKPGPAFEPIELPETLPPEWVEIVNDVQKCIRDISTKSKDLQKLHTARLRVTFAGDKEAEQERQIEILTQEISRLFHQAQNRMTKIASVGNNGKLPRQERLVRFNVMRALATQIQDLSVKFRSTQKDFILRVEGQKNVGKEFFETKGEGKMTLRDVMDREIDPEQLHVLEQIDREQKSRYEDILKLVKSVNDLSLMFRQLNQLVIEQGTILDRIDYNVSTAKDKISKGNDDLSKAEKVSRAPRMVICIGTLFLVMVILLIIVVSKYS